MNIKMNLLEDYVNFVDTRTKQNMSSNMIIVFIVVIVSLFVFFLLFKDLNEEHFFLKKTNI